MLGIPVALGGYVPIAAIEPLSRSAPNDVSLGLACQGRCRGPRDERAGKECHRQAHSEGPDHFRPPTISIPRLIDVTLCRKSVRVWSTSMKIAFALANLTAGGLALAALLVGPAAFAQYTDGIVKIGILTDMSSVYADVTGPGSVTAAKVAIEDFGGAAKDTKIEIVSADHQNRPDIGSNIANSWFDVEKVDVIVDVPNSSVALAVSEIARQKNKLFLASGPGIADLTGPKCNANTIHWTYDTWNLANGTGKAIVKNGGDTWFFITADYAFGYALEGDTASVVQANGGKVLGKARHPLNNNDFSSFLLQAQASKAKVIGLANAGGDTINAIKQANEFGLVKGGQTLAGLLFTAPLTPAVGLPLGQGLLFTDTWYWDMNDANRAWTRRWQVEQRGKYPSPAQAGVYSAIIHYLKAVDALKADGDGRAVAAKMKEMPTDDPLFGKGTVRVDGRKIHEAYLLEVKKPDESKYPGDFAKLRATIPSSEAFRPLKEGGCPLVKG
jgi:branched-chain amino acid transport system substrate-binding protein